MAHSFAEKTARYTILRYKSLERLYTEVSVRVYLQARADGLNDETAIAEVCKRIDREVARCLGKSHENYLDRPDARVRSSASKRAGHGAVSYRRAQEMPEQWMRALHVERAPVRAIVREFVGLLTLAERSNRGRKMARHSWRGLCDRLASEGYQIPESFRNHLA